MRPLNWFVVALAAALVTFASGCARTTPLPAAAAGTALAVITTAGPAWHSTAPTTVPAGSRLRPATTRTVESPVVSSAQPAADQLTWQDGPDELDIAWGGPAPAQTSGAADNNLQGRAAQMGYTVTAAAQVDQELTHPSPAHQRKVIVSGHPAVESTSAAPPSASLGVQADRWVSWQLKDGRYVHIWQANADETTLLAFAATVTEHTITLPQYMTAGLMLPGLPTQFVDTSPGQYGITWCRAGFTTKELDLTGEPCVGLFVNHGDEAYRIAIMINGGPTVQAGNLTVHTGGHQAYALVNNSLSITLNSDNSFQLTPGELASIIAAVRYDSSIPSRPTT